MQHRSLATLTRPEPLPGSGILRPFPSADLPDLDPFVFLDTGAPLQLGDRDIYVGPHPHRGVQPVSLLFRGRIHHRDSLGHDRTVTSGGMQWLVSGEGALHEEVLMGDEAGVFHMAQLWINLPAALKMQPPEHHAAPAEAVPEIEGEGVRVRLYAGRLEGREGPAPMPTPVLVAHVMLAPGAHFDVPITPGWTAAFTVVAGEGQVGEHTLPPGATAAFANDGEGIRLESVAGGELLLLAGAPLAEPIARGHGFVMNTSAEVEAALADYQAGRLGTLIPSRS